jgi:hypothetical protein
MATSVSVGAQPFGRNKVHYGDFDFQILETPHFDIYYYPEEHDGSIDVGRLAERWYTRLSDSLQHTFHERQPIVLYASHAQFVQTNIIPGFLGDGVGGVTEHERGRVVLPFAAGLGQTDHVLGHELVHAFQRDILRENNRSIAMLPLWFVEGMAEYVSYGGIDPNTAMWLRDAVEQNRLPSIEQLDDPSWFPYRYGQALWTYLGSRFGDDVAARALASKVGGGALGRIVSVTHVDIRSLTKGWHEWIRSVAPPRPSAEAGERTHEVINEMRGGGRLNVSPALSPDGRSVVFLSERDQYSIDVFLADAVTGRIKRKITQTASDPHFESLQFVESAGAWDAGGRRFALATVVGGVPALTVFNMGTGDVEREIPLHDLDQAFSPSWSPDGRQIAFSALKGGLSDLFVVDVDSGKYRALTADPYGDLQPSWSPDGRTIAFATDRFTSSLDMLTFGDFRLGTIDVETGAIVELGGLPPGNTIDPHWSRDGANLYFIADSGDGSNVYRLDPAKLKLFRVTNVSTGVSGITTLSPALSVAQGSDRLVFSVYRRGSYGIQAIDESEGTPVVSVWTRDALEQPASSTDAIRLPSSAGESPEGIETSAFHLADARDFNVKPYHAALSLNRIVQPYLSAGGGMTGGFLRAGVTMSFGDMLGDHQLQTTIQAGKSVDDFMAQAAYVNMRSRWNWGLAGGQVPWLTAGLTRPVPSAPGGNTITRETDVFRQLHREASALAIYPFSGAKRLELTGGLHAIAYDRETATNVYSGVTGQLMSTSTATTPAAASAVLVETGAALVYDTAIFGAASPILGQRFRFGVAPTLGSVTFATVTADYRKYLLPIRPFTIAFRAMHVGRYGPGANDSRLLPLVWTLRDVVRGYGDFGPNASMGYLSATRVMVGNAEVRFPIPGVFTGRMQSGPLPIEGLIFSDAGAFWHPSRPDAGVSPLLQSAGAGVRLNAAGFIFEFDAVRPFTAPAHGWAFSFNFRPGF